MEAVAADVEHLVQEQLPGVAVAAYELREVKCQMDSWAFLVEVAGVGPSPLMVLRVEASDRLRAERLGLGSCSYLDPRNPSVWEPVVVVVEGAVDWPVVDGEECRWCLGLAAC